MMGSMNDPFLDGRTIRRGEEQHQPRWAPSVALDNGNKDRCGREKCSLLQIGAGTVRAGFMALRSGAEVAAVGD